MSSSLIYRVGSRTALAVAGSGAAGGAYLYATDEGAQRSMKAYSTFAPVILAYRIMELKASKPYGTILTETVSDDDWEKLDEEYAAKTVAKLAQLQGMYAKYGQTAAGLTNTLGDAWIRELRTLENEIPPRSLDCVRATVEEELSAGGTRRTLEDVFSEFDPTPLGSASIGQVHRARLRGDGREVAVKVQYPEAQELFAGDIHAIRKLCEWFAPEQVCTLDALEQQNAAELDYTNEARNLAEVAANMTRHGFMPDEVLVPLADEELTTRRMLVMELLPGPKLIDGMRAYYETYAAAQGTTLKRMQTVARKKMEEEGIPDRYDGPSAATIARYQRWLGLRDRVANALIAAYNRVNRYSPQSLTRRRRGKVAADEGEGERGAGGIAYLRTTVPPNTPRIVDTLMRVHGCQLLLDGLFNADPHGGNFLLLPDGRIGLIDYGATKRLTENERLAACVMYAALKRGDREKLWTMAKMGGYKSKHMDSDVLYQLQRFGFDSWGKEVTGGLNVQQFMDDLKRRDPWYETPDNFVLASFMSVRLRALTLGMNHPVKCSEWWGEIAERELVRMGLPYETWDEQQLSRYAVEVNIQKTDCF